MLSKKDVLGKVYFRRSHPTGRTPDYLGAARRAVTETPQTQLHKGHGPCSTLADTAPEEAVYSSQVVSSLTSGRLNGSSVYSF